MKKWLGMVCAALLVLGCDNGTSGTTEPGDLTSVEAVTKHLAASPHGQSPDDPVELDVKLDAPEWPQLFEAVHKSSKFVALDLSQCANPPSEFSGGGSRRIVSLVLPEGITALGDGACYNWTSLERITLPEGIISIGEHAFALCKSLERVTLPASLTEIGMGAFGSCTSLKEINIPAKLTTIGREAFRGCSAIKEIDLPESLTEIGQGAFYSCTSLYYLVCRATTPPELIRVYEPGYGSTAKQFDDTASNFWIGVRMENVLAYRAAWSEYADKIFRTFSDD